MTKIDDPHQNGAQTAEVAEAFSRVTTPGERNRAFAILFVSLMCVGAGQSILYAILPPISRQLGLSEVQVTAIFAVSAAIWVFSSPFWGRRSDLMGRKPVMLLGLLALALKLIRCACEAFKRHCGDCVGQAFELLALYVQQRVALLPNLCEIGGILRNSGSCALRILKNVVDIGLDSGI